MSKLPYVQPERELHYNLGMLLLILSNLALTKRNKKVLTIDKIQSFYFLVARPAFLNKVLKLAGKRQLNMDDVDYYTVDTISENVDKLFDRARLVVMIKILASKGFLSTEYSDSEGFLFDLTAEGKYVAGKLGDGHFRKLRLFIEQALPLQSMSPSKLSGYINMVMKQGI
ncbi:hypothetical protein F6455_14710 [Proteobacteria bacterium 005FR1]|nr:hypothetical protein [Proteobacteria bacterium 005FR1]